MAASADVTNLLQRKTTSDLDVVDVVGLSGSVMRNDGEDDDFVFLRSVSPKNSVGLWRAILNVGSPNLNPESLFASNEGMRIKPWMFGVSRKKTKRFPQLLLQPHFRGVIHDGLDLRSRFRSDS